VSGLPPQAVSGSAPLRFPASFFAERSLVLASLDIGRVLADRDGVTFRAQGTCMYPCVRPGDVLRIESRTVRDVSVGEIAVCRRPGCLLGHRIIQKSVKDGRSYIVTRPDRASQGGDGPTFDEDLLGVVTAIERNGRRLGTRKPRHGWPMRAYLAVRLTLLEGSPLSRARLLDWLGYIQSTVFYRCAARFCLSAKRRKSSYVVRVPFQAGNPNNLYRPMTPDKFDPAQPTWQGRRVDRWALALHFSGSRQPAALTTFALRTPECPEAGWRVEEVWVRRQYRGAGFEEELVGKAREILSRCGARLHGSTA